MRHPLGGGAKKRHCRRRVFERGSPPPANPAQWLLSCRGGCPSAAPPGARRPIPHRDRHSGGGGGGGRVEASEWQAAFRRKKSTGKYSCHGVAAAASLPLGERTAWPAPRWATVVARVVAADGSTRDRIGSVSDLRLRGDGGWWDQRGAAPRAPPTPNTSAWGVMEAVEGSRRAIGGVDGGRRWHRRAIWARPTYHCSPPVNVASPGRANVRKKSRGATRGATSWAR